MDLPYNMLSYWSSVQKKNYKTNFLMLLKKSNNKKITKTINTKAGNDSFEN